MEMGPLADSYFNYRPNYYVLDNPVKNISETVRTLNTMEASPQTTQVVLDKIFQGRGNAEKNTVERIFKIEDGTTMIIESGVKVLDGVQGKNNSKRNFGFEKVSKNTLCTRYFVLDEFPFKWFI